MGAPAFCVIRHHVREEAWLPFREWQAREFVPAALRALGYRAASQYRAPATPAAPAAPGVVESWTLYEADDADAADAFRRRPEGRRLLALLESRWGASVTYDVVVLDRHHEARVRRRGGRPGPAPAEGPTA